MRRTWKVTRDIV